MAEPKVHVRLNRKLVPLRMEYWVNDPHGKPVLHGAFNVGVDNMEELMVKIPERLIKQYKLIEPYLEAPDTSETIPS